MKVIDSKKLVEKIKKVKNLMLNKKLLLIDKAIVLHREKGAPVWRKNIALTLRVYSKNEVVMIWKWRENFFWQIGVCAKS